MCAKYEGDPTRAWQALHAELCVITSLNLRAGQDLAIYAHVEQSSFVRAVASVAFGAGARSVQPIYHDQHVRKALITGGDPAALSHRLKWLDGWVNELVASQGALLWLSGNPDLGLFDDCDPARAALTAETSPRGAMMDAIVNRAIAWTTTPCPTIGWASAVFEDDTDRPLERLYGPLGRALRLDREDPAGAWRDRMHSLECRCVELNAIHFDAIRFRGPGTDLRIGLHCDARWVSASPTTTFGQRHIANLPTEEVFTFPDARRADGTVKITRPVLIPGEPTVVRNLNLRFRDGVAIEVSATEGQEAFLAHISQDPCGVRLGEVALVDPDAPTGDQGVIWKESLLDENSGSHIALGQAYPQAIAAGADPPGPAFNVSKVHTDLVVDGPELNVDGVTSEGATVAIIRNGIWRLPST